MKPQLMVATATNIVVDIAMVTTIAVIAATRFAIKGNTVVLNHVTIGIIIVSLITNIACTAAYITTGAMYTTV